MSHPWQASSLSGWWHYNGRNIKDGMDNFSKWFWWLGRGCVWNCPKDDRVIYEWPLTKFAHSELCPLPATSPCPLIKLNSTWNIEHIYCRIQRSSRKSRTNKRSFVKVTRNDQFGWDLWLVMLNTGWLLIQNNSKLTKISDQKRILEMSVLKFKKKHFFTRN